MIHLKRFNESTYLSPPISKEIEQNINDICLELTDVGFTVNIFKPPQYICNKINIYKKSFKYSEVSEIVHRIDDYLKGADEFYKYRITNIVGAVRIDQGRYIELDYITESSELDHLILYLS